jgi:hypothetical protein
MKAVRRIGWLATAAALLYAGRERLAADRLAERAADPFPIAAGTTDPGDAAAAPHFQWLDTHSNPSIVKQGLGGKARAARGAGVLIDSKNRRWEIDPVRPTKTTSEASAAEDGTSSATVPAPLTARVDPAEIARRKDDSLLALKCAGAGALALLLW